MHDADWLAQRFEENRAHLRAVAHRMLGSFNEADDAVQESWLRLNRSNVSHVENLGGWMTTVVARVCLDMLRSRSSRREDPVGAQPPDAVAARPGEGADPEYEAVLADSVGQALLVVLDTLAPTERLAFVLHDMFAVPFDEIASIVGLSPAATRQVASRARRRIQQATVSEGDREPERRLVDAFLAASRNGDFGALLAMLDPNVTLRTDAGATPPGLSSVVHGATAVAKVFSGRAQAARRATVNGRAGAVWAPGGQPRVVFAFTFDRGRITLIEAMSASDRLEELALTIDV